MAGLQSAVNMAALMRPQGQQSRQGAAQNKAFPGGSLVSLLTLGLTHTLIIVFARFPPVFSSLISYFSSFTPYSVSY